MILETKLPGLRLHRAAKGDLDLGRHGRLSLHGNVGGGIYLVHQFKRRFRWAKVSVPDEPIIAFLADWWANAPDQWWDGEYEPVKGVEVAEPPKRRTWVYFVGSDSGPVKIGLAEHPEERLRYIQTGHPSPLRVLATIEGGIKLEREYHSRFAAHRLHGEWFQRHQDIMGEIRRITG